MGQVEGHLVILSEAGMARYASKFHFFYLVFFLIEKNRFSHVLLIYKGLVRVP